jgi:hypothetical protein
LPAWTVNLGPPALAAVLIPLLVAGLAIAVPAASLPAGGTKAGAAAAAPTTAKAAPAKPAATIAPCPPLNVARQAPLGASFQLDGVLSRNGEQVGLRLTIRPAQAAAVAIALPADSFAGDGTGGWLLYGKAVRGGSEVHAVDLAGGCDMRLVRLAGVARGALLDAGASNLYVHSVDAATRADGGVTRVALPTGEATTVVPPFIAGEEFGPVFATGLLWSSDGAALAVQSCGALACATRLLDVASGAVTAYGVPHGELIGVSGEWLYALAFGDARPVPLLAIERAGGAVQVVATAVDEAALVGLPGQPKLRYHTADGWQEVQP